jgi:hypothetical protein
MAKCGGPTCNPSFSDGGDQEDCDLKPVQEKVHRMPFQPIKGIVVLDCHPSCMGGKGRRITV